MRSFFSGTRVAAARWPDEELAKLPPSVRPRAGETLDLILQTMRGLSLPVYHERFDSPLTAEAIYERVKFSQGQKIPLPAAHGAARLYNDVTQEEMDAALALWKEMCA